MKILSIIEGWPGHFRAMVVVLFLGACASIAPKQAIRIAQPNNGPVRNFTSFSASLRCMDGMLAAAKRPRVLISSTGFPDLSKKVTVGADEMLVNAVNQMNRLSRSYVFIDQSLEKDWGQIDLLSPSEDNLRPSLYIRAAVTQVDKGVVADSGSLGLDFTNAPDPWNPFKAELNKSTASAGREASVVTVDMHLVSYPDKTVVPGSSVANSMVVTSDTRGASAGGLIRLTGFNFSIKIARVESLGQAVRNLAELGVIELLGRHARVPYWECLNIRPSNQKLDNLDAARFAALSRPEKTKQIQISLASLGYLGTRPTGILNIETRRAISRFQADQKLIATGEINYQLFVLLKEKTDGFSRNRRPFPPKPEPVPPPALALIPDRSVYRRGDKLRLQLTVQKDGMVTCFHQSGKGPIVQILPVMPGQRVAAKKGNKVSVPGQNAPFDIQFESRGTEEAVLCILSPESTVNKSNTGLTRGALKPVKATSFSEVVDYYRKQSRKISVAEFRTRSK